VTVRIEQETAGDDPETAATKQPDDPLFGMWRDRGETAQVAAYVRKLRARRIQIGSMIVINADVPTWTTRGCDPDGSEHKSG
jgi:hypothetical protein